MGEEVLVEALEAIPMVVSMVVVLVVLEVVHQALLLNVVQSESYGQEMLDIFLQHVQRMNKHEHNY